eukprot:SAG11_NODE_3_length_39220_cov_67.005828_1_plen_148_part_00
MLSAVHLCAERHSFRRSYGPSGCLIWLPGLRVPARWKRLCEDSGTTSEEGFSFGQFRDFWLPGPNRSGNKGGLAQLHAGIYNVNIDSVAKREDWAESLWDSMEYKPGTRVALHSLSGAAEYNGRVGTVLGLHRIKGAPARDVPRFVT